MTEGEGHLTEEICVAILSSSETPQDIPKGLFDHLLRQCPECLAVWRRYLENHRLPGGRRLSSKALEKLDEILQTTLAQASTLRERVRKEEAGVDKLLHELEALLDLPARVTRVRRSRRFRSWVLCERLLGKSQALSFEHPVEAAEIAELAIETAWALDDSKIGIPLISDLMARGWALLAHARRLSGQPQLAFEVFHMSRLFFEEGSGDPLIEAELAGLAALIYRDLGQMEVARKHHDRCIAIYEQLEITMQLAHALLQRSTTRATDGDLKAAAEDQLRALELVDPAKSPRLWLCAEHLLISTLHKLGQGQEARQRFAELRASEHRAFDPWSQLRERRLEAMLACGKDRVEKANAATSATEWRLAESGIFHRSMPPARSLLSELAKSEQ